MERADWERAETEIDPQWLRERLAQVRRELQQEAESYIMDNDIPSHIVIDGINRIAGIDTE